MLITCPSCASEYDIDPSRIGAAGRTVRCAACRESWIVGGPVASLPPEVDKPSRAAPELDEPAAATAVDLGNDAVSSPIDETASTPEFAPPPPTLLESEAPASAAPVIEPEVDRVRKRPDAAKTKRKKPVRRASGPSKGRLGHRLAAAAAVTILVVATPAAILGRARVVAAAPGTATLFAALGMPVNLVGLSFAAVTSTLGRGGSGPVLEVEGRIINAGLDPRHVPPLILVVEDEAGQPLYTWPARAEESEVGPAAAVVFTAKLASPPAEGRRVKVSFGEPASAHPDRTAAADAPHGAARDPASEHGPAHEVASH